MSIIDEARRKFIAKAVVNLGTAIFTIGLASYFFERFSLELRYGLSVASVTFIVGSFFIYPRKRGDKI